MNLPRNTQFCSWCFCSCHVSVGSVGASREIPAHYRRFFRGLGHEIRTCRTARKLSQEDMISYGFSVRHWQMMEAGGQSRFSRSCACVRPSIFRSRSS